MTENVNRNIPPELSDDDAELLSAYLDDMLTAAERETLEARLAVDTFLRTELAAMRRTVDWLNQMPALKAPRDFTISKDAVAQDTPPNVVVMPRRNLWLSAAAAVIVVALFGVVFIAGNMMTAEQNAPAPAAVLRTSEETAVDGADNSAQIALVSTNMPTGTSTPQQEALIFMPTAGFAGTVPPPQTMSLATATETVADIAMAAEVADGVEEAESDDFDAAAGSTMADEAQAAESSLAQANSVASTTTVAATQGINARAMTFTPMPSPTAAPTQAPSTEAALMSAGGAPAEVSNVEMTATSEADLFSQSAPADTTTQSQATGGQPLPPIGAANATGGISLKQEDISLSIRRVVVYILLRYIEFVRNTP